MSTVFFLVCLLVLIASAVYDLISEKIPNAVVLPLLGAGILAQLFLLPFSEYLTRMLILAAIFILYDGFIGAGDAKLVMLLTILCGAGKGLGSLALASALLLLTAAVRDPQGTKKLLVRDWVAIRSMNATSLKNEGPKVPLAPYLLAAFILLSIFGV